MLNILNHLSKTLTRSNGWSTYFAIFISIGQLFLFNSAVAGTTYFTDIDNIKNDFSGPADKKGINIMSEKQSINAKLWVRFAT
jgi:hypothetical protein